MNANQIHIGHEYAIASYGKPNNNEFIPNAHRLKAMRVFGIQEGYNKRLTMYVEGYRMDYDSNLMSTNYVKYRVRDVIEDWDEYEDRKDQWEVERSRIEKERAERLAREREVWEQRRREQEERDRIARAEREERNQEKTAKRNKVLSRLHYMGLSDRGFKVDEYYNTITIPIDDLFAWLNSISEKTECGICERTLYIINQIPQEVH